VRARRRSSSRPAPCRARGRPDPGAAGAGRAQRTRTRRLAGRPRCPALPSAPAATRCHPALPRTCSSARRAQSPAAPPPCASGGVRWHAACAAPPCRASAAPLSPARRRSERSSSRSSVRASTDGQGRRGGQQRHPLRTPASPRNSFRHRSLSTNGPQLDLCPENPVQFAGSSGAAASRREPRVAGGNGVGGGRRGGCSRAGGPGTYPPAREDYSHVLASDSTAADGRGLLQKGQAFDAKKFDANFWFGSCWLGCGATRQ
jgi:hypothetical protein